jgi:hypothetical protein
VIERRAPNGPMRGERASTATTGTASATMRMQSNEC